MYKIMTADEAALLIKDNDNIYINCFLGLGHADSIHRAIYERFAETGHPRNLSLIGSAGHGDRTETNLAEAYVAAGAVRRVINSHFASMPATTRMIRDNQIEGYAIPLGPMSHGIRDMAGGNHSHLTQLGLGIYVDPRLDGPAMNSISREELVRLVMVDGEEYLKYTLPIPDICIIKGTSVDPSGNITFEDEYIYADALSLAQATRANGGKVLVQVDRVSHKFTRPRYVIIPGILVDAVVVIEPDVHTEAKQTLSGEIHVPPAHMDYWMAKLRGSLPARRSQDDDSPKIIGRRAAAELRPDDVVNIGIGLPDQVGTAAVEANILKDITLTVESGGVGGLPAPGTAFGATIGADMICDIATQLDFYDGGGLDVCFMGALEVDKQGNVNVHRRPEQFVGIGGFGNITASTHKVVFCFSFTARGLVARAMDGGVHITSEGSIPKLVQQVGAISFSAERALARGQQVLYVTERCVFKLGPQGLVLIEVYPGVDVQKDILDLLPFEIEVELPA